MNEDTETAAIVLRQSTETQLEGDKKLSVELKQIIITAEALREHASGTSFLLEVHWR